ncbi:hypothetical protein P0D88_05500 [Paraburkholderia sp. RL18-103-BIB-C]|uniref:hypothetical protein n=1 Tax=Paraburkholderia sp. RL18-103-BIB-C TaxID=3031637 RepID=UPI0038BBADEB
MTMGMAGALPGLKEDILSLYAAVLANFHVCAEYDLTSATPDWLALEYVSGHQTRVFSSALGVAVKMRSFFDIHRKNEALSEFLRTLPTENKRGPLCRQSHPAARDLSLRSACNKIIHSLKVEFMKGKIESKKFDPPVTFINEVPTEHVILAGTYDSIPWVCSLNLLVFCSLAFELLQWVESTNIRP